MPPAKQKPAEKPKKVGRGAGTPNYVPNENLACALASLEASESKQTMASVDLNAEAADRYAAQLKAVNKLYEWPFTTTKARGGQAWTEDESIEARGKAGITYVRWNETVKPYCMNTIQRVYESLLVDGGGMQKEKPSGKSLEDMKRKVIAALWAYNQTGKPMPATTKVKKEKASASASASAATADGEEVEGEEEEVEDAGEQSEDGEDAVQHVKEMPANFDGGQFFLTWFHLGPLGLNHPCFQVEGGAKQPKGQNREAQRNGALDDDASDISGPEPKRGKFDPQGHATGHSRAEQLLEREVVVEEHNTALTARRDRIAELKDLLELDPGDDDTKTELRALLKSAPPPKPTPLPTARGTTPSPRPPPSAGGSNTPPVHGGGEYDEKKNVD